MDTGNSLIGLILGKEHWLDKYGMLCDINHPIPAIKSLFSKELGVERLNEMHILGDCAGYSDKKEQLKQ
jgi:hypothetical protein